jgi:alpha-glucosidase
MQWDDSPTGGFTAAGVRSWLPAGDVVACNVAAQRLDPGSVLSLCRELLRVRRAHAGAELAGYEPLPAPDGVWHFAAGGLSVAANFTGQRVRLPSLAGEVLVSSTGTRHEADPAALGPWEGVIAARAR